MDDSIAAYGPTCIECPFLTHTVRGCDGATCTYTCAAGYYDYDGLPGCEYECFGSNGGVEKCDGSDNDCNGWVDDALALADAGGAEAPAVCLPGAAAGALGVVDESSFGVVTRGGQSAPQLVVEFRKPLCVDSAVAIELIVSKPLAEKLRREPPGFGVGKHSAGLLCELLGITKLSGRGRASQLLVGN